jgi:hypothetical protein
LVLEVLAAEHVEFHHRQKLRLETDDLLLDGLIDLRSAIDEKAGLDIVNREVPAFGKPLDNAVVKPEADETTGMTPGIHDALLPLIAWQNSDFAIHVGDPDRRFIRKAIGDHVAFKDIAVIIFDVEKQFFPAKLLLKADQTAS